jgi:hypothetical protein
MAGTFPDETQGNEQCYSEQHFAIEQEKKTRQQAFDTKRFASSKTF